MKPNFIFKKILRRPFFRGQDRIFNFLFKRGLLQVGTTVVKPLIGNFKISCDTNTWIGGKIVYTGDYESSLKKVFKAHINYGDIILDIGANIGFHSLYFSELTGEKGLVIAFEPVPTNFEQLNANINLNNFKNIFANNFALGNKNELFNINADVNSTNPGAFNLFDKTGNVEITCKIGDEIIGNQKIAFIKIDVEGYESFVIEGLLETIKKNRPTIIFEYDIHYHKKTGLTKDYIFSLLSELNYRFMHIYQDGPKILDKFDKLQSGNILAIPND